MVGEGIAAVIGEEADLTVVGLARTVERAERLIGRERPDVVLVDFRLPDGDGAEVTERALAVCPTTQVVMLTAADAPGVLERAIEAGASGFVHKSEPIERVVRAVRAVHAGDGWFRPQALASVVGTGRGSPASVPAVTLTAREQEILELLASGASTAAMVESLILSPHTVRNHVRNVMAKLGAHSKLEAVSIAARAGIVTLGERQ